MFANVIEVMSSIQGEGIFVGQRQAFVRFFGCNLSCPYCDTPNSLGEVRQCKVEKTPGKRDFTAYQNPLGPENLVGILEDYDLAKLHSISFTGGEPLLQAEFLSELIPRLKGKGPKMFLETNGTLPSKLKQVVDLLDIISMDIKLTGVTPWDAHSEFLKVAAQKQVYVKTVILPDTKNEEIVLTAQLIKDINPAIPLVLQPVTPSGAVKNIPAPDRMIEFQDLALNLLRDVRVIPQTHKFMGQL